MRSLLDVVESLCDLPAHVATDEFASRFESVLRIASHCLDDMVPVSDVSAALAPARRLVAASAFVRRLQTWPRGYPGDFQTIEQIVQRRNSEAAGTLAHAAEQWALDSAPCQQHRNKVAAQSALITDTVRRARGARILSVASGPNCDVRRVADDLEHDDCTLVINDADPDAIAFSRERLGEKLLERTILLTGNVFTSIRDVSKHGEFDLILAGGLFDYLTDRQAAWLLGQLAQILAPSGVLFFTNIAAGNPFRLCMEQITAWTLIERSPDDLRALANGIAVPLSVDITTDATGLALLATLTHGGKTDR